MSDKPVKILIPKERFQIGTTPDGQPVWVEPKELLPSEDEKLQLKENLMNSRERGAIQKMVALVFENAARFVQDTFYHVAPKEVIAAHEDGKMDVVAEWVSGTRYEVIQDGIATVIKSRGKVIREMKAKISGNAVELVERKIRQMMAVRN
jgi:hypothetical protein